MNKELDDKLREILSNAITVYGTGGHKKAIVTGARDHLIALIKAAFVEAGYQKSFTLEPTVVGYEGLMTGQEWAKQTLEDCKDDNGNIDPLLVVEVLEDMR